jgi:hypothetical protein
MACQIVIQQVAGQPLSGTWLASVTVTGTATDCSQVKVTINCRRTAVSHQVPVAAGTWTAVFSLGDLKSTGCEECGNFNCPITVQASCADPNSLCTPATLPLKEIPCAGCPTIGQIEADVPPCSDAASGWNVSFSASINGTGVTECLWDFGDGTNPTVGPLPQGGVATIQHLYRCAGPYLVSLTILSNCQPNYTSSQTTLVQLPTCGCPHISGIFSNPVGNNPCTWNFMAKVGDPFLQCIQGYLWNFGDGNELTSSAPEATHTYGQSGSYTVTLTLQGPIGPVGGGVCYATTNVSVSNCGGTGGNGNGCPWWWPFCKGWSFCAVLLAAALAAFFVAGLLALLAGCALPEAVASGPVAGIWAALAISALFTAAEYTLAAGLALLALWYLVCARLLGINFCSELTQIKNAIASFIIFQESLGAVLWAAGGVGCWIGMLLTAGVYGTVLSALQILGWISGCH